VNRASIEVKLKSFQVPNFATIDLNPRHLGDRNEATLPIKDLSDEALDSLAQEWLVGLYSKAGRRSPFHIIEGGAK
jgi:hypothetical protein